MHHVIFRSFVAFSQAILRNTSTRHDLSRIASVSRARHLPVSRAATPLGVSRAGSVAEGWPFPLPSRQLQSLPKISLSCWRARNSAVNSGLRESALLPEFAERSA